MININANDYVYTYKETFFTGFAPCFDDNLYSMACCKGNVKNGGMRRSICKKAEESNKTSIWVLAIAGKNLITYDSIFPYQEREFNSYESGDIIYLAKVDSEKLYSWKEYSEKFKNRTDMIYNYDNGKMVRNDKIHEIHTAADNCVNTDCGTGIQDYCDYWNVKQIFMTEDFFVFKPGTKVCDFLSVNRGYRCNGENRAKYLQDLIEGADILFDKKSPFILK